MRVLFYDRATGQGDKRRTEILRALSHLTNGLFEFPSLRGGFWSTTDIWC